MCFLAISLSSLRNCIFRYLLIFCLFFFWHTVAWIICIFWKLIPCQWYSLQIFSPSLWIVFLFCSQFPSCAETFSFVYFSFYFHYSGMWIKKKRKEKILLRFVSKSVLPIFLCFVVSCLTFRFLIHFEFIFL